ncbi:MAG: tRNA (adenosine(37)-N6)-threonylcarbamoyltransferase complex dimerization subunit type 1 TsaB [Chitinophagaceae bacterium]|nr:tRNA (adenosine(37)-N6)-threonylcarbamoyltransferase complex dimerization subunit type 1 TsaB [Chitinophagaceae bacterium]
MSLILNIDTSEQIATVSIAENGLIFALQKNETQNKHAAFLHTAIKSLLDNLPNQKINAVAVVAGPGSYTGLRVGMSAAKGLCYALNLPLITINSLAMIGHAAVKHSTEKDAYLCPMIDARRMEVFTALYSHSLKEIIAPKAEIINEEFLNYIMKFANNVIFMGTGAIKISKIFPNSKYHITDPTENFPSSMAMLSYSNFYERKFASLALSEPFYIKDFYGK